ncbi:GIMA8 GTPase, partial [Atractosteus spatula]|nr:GIMA8 GTPase [Atractosteus spatula]
MWKFSILFNLKTGVIAFCTSPTGQGLPDSRPGAPDVISDLPELRLVLLGRAGAGKSTAGNTILGREEFQTDRITTLSTKSEGVVAGRQITLVDTPGWDGTLRLDTPKKVKQEIELSASLCFPGPHAFLLVIPLDSPTEKAAAKELSEIFNQNAWWHTMLLFTCKESLEGRTIEELIESAGEELHQLLKKCGDRYHVLCTKNRTNPMQIEKLLEKSEKLATENNGVYIKNEILTEQEVERPQKQEPREEELVMKEGNRNRKVMNLNLPNPKDEVELGKEPKGKPNSDSTPMGNTILGQEEFTSMSPDSSSAGKKECEIRKGQVFGRQVAVINIPDWFSTEFSLDEIQSQIESYVSLSEPGSYALLLVVPLDQPVGNGRRTGDAIQEVFGEQSVRFTLVLFTHGDVLKGKTIDNFAMSDDTEIQHLLDKYRKRYHILDNTNLADRTQVKELLGKIESMLAEDGSSFHNGEIYTKESHLEVKQVEMPSEDYGGNKRDNGAEVAENTKSKSEEEIFKQKSVIRETREQKVPMSERMLECKDREVTTLQRAGQERETNQRERQDSLQTQDTERTHAVKKSSKLINTYQTTVQVTDTDATEEEVGCCRVT